jgi:hypothetical protein
MRGVMMTGEGKEEEDRMLIRLLRISTDSLNHLFSCKETCPRQNVMYMWLVGSPYRLVSNEPIINF